VLITSQKKKHLFLIRSAKFRERIDAAVDSAQRASKYALQKADIAISRTATARGKAELADLSADHAKVDSEIAIQTAREFAPDFKPSLLERFERIRVRERFRNTMNEEPPGGVGGGGIKTKANESQQVSAVTSNSMISPNKTQLAATTTTTSNQIHHQQQQQQNLLNPPQPAPRRTSMLRQASIDYTSSAAASPNNAQMYSQQQQQQNQQVDYNNTLSQQFGQPQPPGSAFSTPQKFAQQQNATQLNQGYQQSSSNQYAAASQQDSYNSYQQQSTGHNYQQQQQQQAPMVNNSNDMQRRTSRQISDSGRPMLGAINQPASIDHFDHYKRPPSRDSSVDRYSRAASRLGGGSRQPSVDRQALNVDTLIDPRNVRAGSQLRGTTPAPNVNGSVLTGSAAAVAAAASRSRAGSRSGTPVFQQQPSIQSIQAHYSTPNQPFEDVLLRQRTLGQDIIPSPGQPKRTESLFVPNKPVIPSGSGGGGGGGGSKQSSSKVSLVVQF